MKRRVSSLFVLLGVFCVAACRPRAPQAIDRPLQAHLRAEPATLDPLLTTDESGTIIEDLLFTPLVTFDRDLRIVPGLAKSWQLSADHLTYTFELDPEATFDDGTPVLAQDVRFTLERIRDPNVPALQRKADFKDLSGVDVLGPHTVRVRFSRPYSEQMIAFNLPIVPKHVFDRGPEAARAYGRHPVGNGPYRFVRWDTSQTIVIERRQGPAGRAAGIGRMIFRILPDQAAWINAGIRGDLDEMSIPQQAAPRYRSDPAITRRFRLETVPRPSETLIVWNCHNPLLSDPAARRALGLAIPRAHIIDAIYHGNAVAVSGPYPAGVPENAPDVAPLPYDPAASRRLLTGLGYRPGPDGILARGGRRFNFELLIPSGQNVSVQIAQILKEEFRKIGVSMDIRALDWPAFSARTDAGEFDASFFEWYFVPPNFDPYACFHSSQWPPHGTNSGFYKNADVDRLLEQARTEFDPDRRLALYREIHRRIAADQPCAFLYSVHLLWAINRDLSHVETSPLGLIHFVPGMAGWRWSR
jgi:peptide/nickel transport system substrate-binding protein